MRLSFRATIDTQVSSSKAKNKQSQHLGRQGYTEAINTLDYSSVVIPVTRADTKLDQKDGSFEPLSEADQKSWEACERSCP